MSSLVGTRRGHAAGTAVGGKPTGRLLSAARPSRTVRRAPSAPAAPAHGLPTEIQRNRVLTAAIRSLDASGFAQTSVAQITTRARISRRTFYELFATREECMLAVFEEVVGRIERDLSAAELEDLPWRERVREGLWRILSLFEREPVMARICVVLSLQGDAKLLARRELLIERLGAVVDEGREQSAKAAQATPLTAEGLVGAACAIVYARLLREEREPLTALLGELMGLIALPYLGPAAARRERERPLPAAICVAGEESPRAERSNGDPFEGISIRLTYRTMRVLECVASQPGASNRQVGALAGVPDQGQISKLLARLERLGLLVNVGKARPKGEPNMWELTERGLQVTQTIGMNGGMRQ